MENTLASTTSVPLHHRDVASVRLFAHTKKPRLVELDGFRFQDLFKWKSAHKRFARWAKAGVWERVFAELTSDPKNEYLMLDATLVRAHQQAATGKGGAKRGLLRTRLWGVPEVD